MAELRPPEVDPYFERKKIALGGVTKSLQAAILTLEQNPPERKFLRYIKILTASLSLVKPLLCHNIKKYDNMRSIL